MRPEKRVLLGSLVAVAVFGADQYLKGWAHAWVGAHGNLRPVHGLNIIATSNTGVAFSVAQDVAPGLLIAIGIALAGLFAAWLWRSRSLVHAAGLGLAIGGALGNVADRLRFGSVRDFIDVYWSDHHWPAFNLADAAVVIGLALLILFPSDHAKAMRPDGPSR